MDGGTLINVDIPGAVNGCLSEGFREEQIIIDTVMCSNKNLKEFDRGDTLATWLRAREIRKYYSNISAISQWRVAYPNA